MNEPFRIVPLSTTLKKIEEFLNDRAANGWEFVAFYGTGYAVFRNVQWDPNSGAFFPRGMKRP